MLAILTVCAIVSTMALITLIILAERFISAFNANMLDLIRAINGTGRVNAQNLDRIGSIILQATALPKKKKGWF